MNQLLPDECRVLGTLIEKAFTTSGQYPLSLNSLVTGVNQKSNRDPIVEIDEDSALRAIDGLRARGLARDVTFTGSRVEKYRHLGGEGLDARPQELALLAELMLRGPQTVGELRGRASRMQPFDSLETVEAMLAGLAGRSDPMVRELAPSPGSRAPRWMQLLCEKLHPTGPTAMTGSAARAAGSFATTAPTTAPTTAQTAASEDRVRSLEDRVAALEASVAELKSLLA